MKNALLKETKTKLVDLLKSQGELSIDEITEKLALAKTTIRRHLIILERQGLIQRSNRIVSAGRPQLVYRLTENAIPLFPSKESDLLRDLLAQLISDGKGEWVDRFFRNYWQQRHMNFQERLRKSSDQSPQAAAKILLAMLEEDGFMPEILKEGDHTIVRECNCPFSETVKVTRIPCQLEAEFLQAALRANLERVSYIPTGSPTCTYVLRTKKKRLGKKSI